MVRIPASVPARCLVAKGRDKFSSRRIPRNPLKSLDSHERIQGNPRKSKLCFRAVPGKTAMVQENPNRSSKRAARAANKADAPIPSNCEALPRDDGPDPLRLAQSRYISPSACPAVTGRGLPSSSMATKVKVASVTFRGRASAAGAPTPRHGLSSRSDRPRQWQCRRRARRRP
jgi:hypothetical protein